jgi:hypothetical protein
MAISIELAGLISLGLMMPDLRHVERAGDPAHHRRDRPDHELVRARAVAEEHQPRLLVADRRQHAAELAGDDPARDDQRAEQVEAGQHVQRGAHLGRGDRHSEDALEVGEAVVAAEPHVVAEERQHRGVGERLRDDREVHALDARAEREEAEGEREQAGHRHDQHQGPQERVGADPVPGQFLPVEEHHEVRQVALVDAVAADLPHQVHAERVAAEGEEQALSERQDAGVAPDQVHRQRDHRVAHELAEQRDPEARHVQRVRLGQREVQRRKKNDSALRATAKIAVQALGVKRRVMPRRSAP